MKRSALAGGLGILGLAWFALLNSGPGSAFAVHMAAHMAVVAIAAPLFALAVAGTRLDPVRAAPALFAAIPASLVEWFAVWMWHAPALHQAARHRVDALVLEQASFLGAGLYFWLSVTGGGDALRRRHRGGAVVAMALTFAHMTLLGALLSLTPRVLYLHPGTDAAWTLADQQLGGSIMLVASTVVYVGAGVWLSADLLKSHETRRTA